MSSGRGDGRLSSTGASDPSVKGKIIVEGSGLGVDHLSQVVGVFSSDAGQDEGWEFYSRKSKNKSGKSVGKQWVLQNSASKVWANADTVKKLGSQGNAGSQNGRGNNQRMQSTQLKRPDGRADQKPESLIRGCDNDNAAPTPAVGPPLRNGWDWYTRAVSAQSSDGLGGKNNVESVNPENVEDVKVDDDDLDILDDSDDELLSDDFDSDASEKSHETYKKDRWFKDLFECLDSLTVEKITEPEREWHCPACKGGPGAIKWFSGLQPLITHAKTEASKRVKLHRKLVEVLEEELRRRGASTIQAGEFFGSWKGLNERVEKEIVWPPMVMIVNTRLEKDKNDKWFGMGNEELLSCFSSYDAVKARHSYGPRGHRGMSVLIFEASPIGYMEAERLSKHFEDNGRDRTAWESRRVAFYPGGQRQLYGYMAEKRDLENFNLHSQGKMKLKFEMLSYQEMVVKQLKQMGEDNQQLVRYKNKFANAQKHSKVLEDAYGMISEKYHKTLEENRIVRQRSKMLDEQRKEELDDLEQFFKEELKMIYDAREEKEENFEKIQQEERETVKQSQGSSSSIKDHRQRVDEFEKFIQGQDEEMEEFVAERGKLIELHAQRMVELKRRRWEEQVALEKELNAELAKLMKKYTPKHSELVTSNNSSI